MMEKCRDCGTHVSSSASSCPKCGCQNPSLPERYNRNLWLLAGTGFLAMSGCVACLVTGENDPEFEREVYELGREWLENREAGR